MNNQITVGQIMAEITSRNKVIEYKTKELQYNVQPYRYHNRDRILELLDLIDYESRMIAELAHRAAEIVLEMLQNEQNIKTSKKERQANALEGIEGAVSALVGRNV